MVRDIPATVQTCAVAACCRSLSHEKTVIVHRAGLCYNILLVLDEEP